MKKIKKVIVLLIALTCCMTVGIGAYTDKPVSALTVIAEIKDVSVENNVLSVGESTKLSVEWEYGIHIHYQYTTSDESVVKIENTDEYGCTLTGVGSGTAEITVHNDYYSKSIEVTVKEENSIEYTYPSKNDDYKTLIDEYPEYYRLQGKSVYFMEHSTMSSAAMIVSSNEEHSVEKVNFGYVFTPENDGVYAVTLEETFIGCTGSEDIHAEYEYKNHHYYLVNVSDGVTSVSYSDSYENIIGNKSCIEKSSYYSFVNGNMPDGDNNGYDKYFTTVYDYNKVQSYFCLNSPHDEGFLNTKVTTSNNKVAYNSMNMRTSSGPFNDDIQTLSLVIGVGDGDVVITLNNSESYYLKVENGVFHYLENTEQGKPVIKGDVNDDGVFNIADMVMLQKYLAKKISLTENQLKCGDMNGDGKVNVFDAVVMKRKLIEAYVSAVEPALMLVNHEIWAIGSESRTTASVIDTKGTRYSKVYDEMSYKADYWAEQRKNIISGGDKESFIEDEEVLTAINEIVKNASKYENCEMTDGNSIITDTGEETLYVLYTDEKGDTKAVELGYIGGCCAWLDNKEVQDFIDLLVNHGYFGVYGTYKDWQNNPPVPARMPHIDDSTGDITGDMKKMIWNNLAYKYPDTDFTDFSLVYEPEHPLKSHLGEYVFSVYYKDYYLCHGYGNINTDGNVYVTPDTVNFVCEPEQFTKVDVEAKRIPIDELGYNIKEYSIKKIIYVDALDKSKTPVLAYRIVSPTDNYEEIINAVTGELIEVIMYTVP